MVRRAAEVVTALLWLTRLSLGRFLPDPAPSLAQSAWAFPVAGAVVGVIAALSILLADGLGLSSAVAAILGVAATIWLTGALHEDGLADYADGCGASTRERSLQIMRDSRIGSYGVLALLLAVALRVACLADLIRIVPVFAALSLIGAAMLSRAGMAAALALMWPARGDGLGRAAGRASPRAAACALMIACIPLLLMVVFEYLSPLSGLLCMIFGLAAQAALARQALRRLGGQTGDVLGAIQQVGEVSTLLALVIAAQRHAA